MDLGGWLRSLGLEQYETAFRENAIDDTVLPNLTAEDLKDLGVRRKLLMAIAALRTEASAKAPLAFERAQRMKSMERVRIKLAALQKRVAKGRLTSAERIGAAAGAILARNHGHRYYDWRLEKGEFQFFEHPVYFTREQAYEGKYIIQTEEKNLSPLEAVLLYKELSPRLSGPWRTLKLKT
jgi:hypothetical protein